MLAVFNKTIAKIHLAMKNPESDLVSATADRVLARKLLTYYPHATTFNFGTSGYMAIDESSGRGRQVASYDDLFCLVLGRLENTGNLRKYLELTPVARDPHIILEIYKVWKNEEKHIVDSPMSEFEGRFAFIMYDMSCDYVAIGVDNEGSIPLFWGVDSEHNFVVSSFLPLIKEGCSRSYALFPAGCLYTNTHGLMKFSQPLSTLEAVPWTDDSGQVCGADFRTKREVKGRFHIVSHYPKSKQ